MTVDRSQEQFVSVLAGGFAGVCSTCITNPLDTVRVRLAASREASGKTHKSLIGHARELFSGGILAGFRTGLLVNILASMPSNAVYLPTYRYLNTTLTERGVGVHVVPVAAALGAVATTNLTLSPFFLVRTRCQVDERQTISGVVRDVLRRDGVRGFYRGALTNVAGRFVEEATFWFIFESLKRATNEGTFKDRSFVWASMAVLSLSMVSKLIGTSIAYPYNVVMTHLRTVNKVTQQHEHTRFWPTVRHIYKADGVAGFYKGLAPQLLRSVLSKATQIYAFELAMAVYLTKVGR